ncbi:pilus assembly protein [Rhizobiaceae bacterium]|nr:pilus assembly protein [Rhizobiaceae bacterium]
MTRRFAAISRALHARLPLDRFRQDDKGIAMVEFAMVLPFLVALWLGLAMLADMENTSTRVSRVTATIGDIVAQSSEVTDDDLDKTFRAAEAFMGTEKASKLQMYVVGLKIDEDGKVTVAWSRGKNLTDVPLPQEDAPYTVPANLTVGAENTFLVAAYGKFIHQPLYGSRFKTDYEYEYENFFAPRLTDEIEKK